MLGDEACAVVSVADLRRRRRGAEVGGGRLNPLGAAGDV
jgi:hypothetical protein